MSDQNTSSLQSAIDKVSGAAQSAYGAIVGNSNEQAAGQDKQTVAEARNDVSHAGATIGGHSVSASGVAKNDPNRSDGSWNQTVGAGKETLGGLIGNQNLKQEGARQNQEGKSQEAQGQLSDLGKGVGDRVTGTLGGAVAGITGDRDAQLKAQQQHDQGKTLQRGVEADLDKVAQQEQKK